MPALQTLILIDQHIPLILGPPYVYACYRMAPLTNANIMIGIVLSAPRPNRPSIFPASAEHSFPSFVA